MYNSESKFLLAQNVESLFYQIGKHKSPQDQTVVNDASKTKEIILLESQKFLSDFIGFYYNNNVENEKFLKNELTFINQILSDNITELKKEIENKKTEEELEEERKQLYDKMVLTAGINKEELNSIIDTEFKKLTGEQQKIVKELQQNQLYGKYKKNIGTTAVGKEIKQELNGKLVETEKCLESNEAILKTLNEKTYVLNEKDKKYIINRKRIITDSLNVVAEINFGTNIEDFKNNRICIFNNPIKYDTAIAKQIYMKNRDKDYPCFYIVANESHWNLAIQEKDKILLLDPTHTDNNKFFTINDKNNLVASSKKTLDNKIQYNSGCCEYYTINMIFLFLKLQIANQNVSIFDAILTKENKISPILYNGLVEKAYSSDTIDEFLTTELPVGCKLMQKENKDKTLKELEENGIVICNKEGNKQTIKIEDLREKIFEYRISILNKNIEALKSEDDLLISREQKLKDFFIKKIQEEIKFLSEYKEKLKDCKMIKGGYMFREATSTLLGTKLSGIDKKSERLQQHILSLDRYQKIKNVEGLRTRDDSFLDRLKKERESKIVFRDDTSILYKR